MVKVLLATNEEQLDNAILSEPNIEGVSNPIYYLEAVVQMAQKTKPDVVVLTAWLGGTVDIVDVVYELRSMDIRVVFLAGTLEPDDPVVQGVAKLAVYDVLFGEITIGQVIEKILNPTPASQGIALVNRSSSFQQNTPKEVNCNVVLDNEDQHTEETTKENFFMSQLKNLKLKHPTNESSKKTIKDLTTYIKVPSIKVPKMKAGNRFKKNDYKLKNLVIAVTSPWIPNIGTTRLAISLSNKLNSNIIDADLAGKGVGIRLGVPLENTWEYDWRNDTGPVLLEGNRTAWTLDPYIENSDESLLLPLHETIYQIQSAGNLVIDAGSDPLAWYAQEVFKVCDVVCVVISADPLHIARSLPKWRQLAPITKPIVAALVTEGDTNEVVKEYGVECVHTPGAVNNVSKLVTLIYQSISSAEKYTS